MSNTLLILGGIALVGIGYYSYKRKKAKETVSKEMRIGELLNLHSEEIEKVEKLSLLDVVNYFKGLQLKKGIDVPFVGKDINESMTIYILGTYNEEKQELNNLKVISPDSVDEDLLKVVGNEKLVVLS